MLRILLESLRPGISLTSRNGMGKREVIVSEYDEVNKTITWELLLFVITIPEARNTRS